jgi:Holliday junction resolvase
VTQYQNGARFEAKVKAALEEDGYGVMRAGPT